MHKYLDSLIKFIEIDNAKVHCNINDLVFLKTKTCVLHKPDQKYDCGSCTFYKGVALLNTDSNLKNDTRTIELIRRNSQ